MNLLPLPGDWLLSIYHDPAHQGGMSAAFPSNIHCTFMNEKASLFQMSLYICLNECYVTMSQREVEHSSMLV